MICFVFFPCRVTGKGYMDVNRISGYIPGKMVFFLMQVAFHMMCHMNQVILPFPFFFFLCSFLC